MRSYDVVVVGGGPGGYASALRAAGYGRSVALVEKGLLGGTCLNLGCIPSKTLLHVAHTVDLMQNAKRWGVETTAPVLHLERITAHRNAVIQRLRGGIDAMLKAGKVDLFRGEGTVHPDLRVVIESADEATEIHAKHVVLATGSKPVLPPIAGLERVKAHTSDTIFDLETLPKSIAIVGGGVIGLEFAAIFSGFRAEVTVVEAADRVLASEDADAAQVVERSLRRKGVRFITGASVEAMREEQGGKAVAVRTATGLQQLVADEILVAAGRRPDLRGLAPLGLRMNGPFVAVDDCLETNVPNVYAVGDLIGGRQLAHVATAEGHRAIDNIVNGKAKMDYRVVPRCLYTSPEIASVGIDEREARERGLDVEVSTFPFAGTGKAIAVDEPEGFVKLIADRTFGEIVGVVIVGAQATELIGEASAYMHLEGTVEEMAAMIHPHPTLSEALFEAADRWRAGADSSR